LVNKEHKIRVGLWITDNKKLFDDVYKNKTAIESAAGTELNWDRLNGKKACVICTDIPGLDFNKQENYPELMNRSIDLVIAFRQAFAPYIPKQK
jgi:hypothetical protein